jgi:hypothetical protein
MRQVEMPQASKYQRLNKGSFSKINHIKGDGTLVAMEWLRCREYFQDESQGIRRFLFCHKPNKSKHIAAFMHGVEGRLGLFTRSVVGPTQRHNISWIRSSPWWTSTSMKRSLFTILLRCGQNYHPKIDDFDDALFSDLYTKHTEFAVRRFMDGYTKYTGQRRGWYNQFRWESGTIDEPKMPSKQKIERLLVLP